MHGAAASAEAAQPRRGAHLSVASSPCSNRSENFLESKNMAEPYMAWWPAAACDVCVSEPSICSVT